MERLPKLGYQAERQRREVGFIGCRTIKVRTAAPGSKDKDILAWAEREAWVLLTVDKDFGELAWHVGLPASFGVVVFRLPMPAAAEVGVILAARIGERTDWPDTSRLLNQGVSACTRLRHNNFLDETLGRLCDFRP